jgi:hypothetical protein
MRRGRQAETGEKPSPEQRYDDFAKDNAAWDRKVKKSIDNIEKASRRGARQRDVIGR